MVDRKSSVSVWAKYILSNNPLFLDTETTGTKSQDKIVDIAAVDMHGNVVYETLVNPGRSIPEESSAIHGITDEMVRDAPAWIDIYGRIASLVENNRPVVIYNLEFDKRMVHRECAWNQLPLLATAHWHCAMLKFAEYIGEIGRRGDYRWHRLNDAVKMMKLDLPEQSHRAAGDAIYTAELVKALAGKLDD